MVNQVAMQKRCSLFWTLSLHHSTLLRPFSHVPCEEHLHVLVVSLPWDGNPARCKPPRLFRAAKFLDSPLPPPSPHHSQTGHALQREGWYLTGQDKKSASVGIIEKAFTWRMQQPPPEQSRKYQLFPKDRQLPVLNNTKNLDPEKAFALAMNQNAEKSDKPSAASGLRIRINAPTLGRRRKISVPEAGPMTTVQEVSMDSRMSSPVPFDLDTTLIMLLQLPFLDDLHYMSAQQVLLHKGDSFTFLSDLMDDDDELDTADENQPPHASASARPLSPRDLAPLVIPPTIAQPPRLISKRSISHLRSGSQPSETLRSLRYDESPMGRGLLTPSTSTTDLTTPRSASTTALSATTLPTPVSAPIMECHRASPKPWVEGRCPTPSGSERAMTPLTDDGHRPGTSASRGHRRGASESSSTSIMDRGRPRKRTDGRMNNTTNSKNDSKPPKSAERKAFEELPKGWKPSEVAEHMSGQDLKALRKQAFSQVERFEILRPEDVENLSKELRSLDERTEYLRRTYTSLRAGRRNLHARICQYLRSPRVAKFSHESMLKQEEALAELDASIDDWVSKLEMAENRRTRVRQKLLEHVAAAAILPSSDSPSSSPSQSPQPVGHGVHTISTPPRSPTKQTFTHTHTSSGSPSPQRVVAQVPSTILEQPIVEEATANSAPARGPSLASAARRSDAESIRVYVGNDIYLYSLLADVENEISKMNTSNPDPTSKEAIESKRRELHRKMSHEILNGLTESPAKLPLPKLDLNSSATPLSPPAPTPPMKDEQAQDGLLLSNSVFKP
ncbi:hypothetical protein HJFPF1_03725 [Paramyrothecium foliicola]|nr:hypothetical protein HJFPF1_03725 [Paramyrothecium foliicola]